MNDAEKKLLEQIAAARGVTVESLLGEVTKPDLAESEPTAERSAAQAPKQEPEDDDPVVTFAAAAPAADAAPLPPMEEAASLPPAEEQADAKPAAGEAPAGQSECQHCGWVLSEPVLSMPTLDEITNFLHCCLGQKLYSEDYKLLGGRLTLRVRALRVRELEAIYDSAHRLQVLGVLQGQGSYYEYINRMRFYLQVTRLAVSVNEQSTIFQLPEVLDAAICRITEPDWRQKLQSLGQYDEKLPLLDQVRDYMIATVLSTEHLQRIVSTTCARFNRKVALLESRMEDLNFWNEVGLPT
jgi:hypothetical protein